MFSNRRSDFLERFLDSNKSRINILGNKLNYYSLVLKRLLPVFIRQSWKIKEDVNILCKSCVHSDHSAQWLLEFQIQDIIYKRKTELLTFNVAK